MAEQKIKGVKKFFEEFKAFAMRGNVLDMAVGVVVGSAFTAIVNSLVGDRCLCAVPGAEGLQRRVQQEEGRGRGSSCGADHQGLPLLPERDLHQGRALPPVHLQAGRLPRDQRLSSLKKHSAPVHCKIAVSGGAFL